MFMRRSVRHCVGLWHSPHDERGLSQSTESVILLVGAVTIAIAVITVVTAFVKSNLILIP